MPKLAALFTLDEHVAVVTGAGRGLGKAMAGALAGAGAAVAVLEIEGDLAQETAGQLQEAGAEARAWSVDVTTGEEVRSAFSEVEATLGPPTVLVNNAGITTHSVFEELPPQDWQRVMAVNLGGLYHATQAFGRLCLQRGGPGSVINIASISGLVGNRGGNNSHYCASKGGVIALTRSLAVEWAEHQIRVNAIAPGYFQTPMTDRLKARDEPFYQELVGRVPLGRFGRDEDLAGAVIFLASGASAYISGHVLVVDGGYTAW